MTDPSELLPVFLAKLIRRGVVTIDPAKADTCCGIERDDDGYDYDVKHDPDRCAQEDRCWGRDYSCDVATELMDAGIDAFGMFDNALSHLSPGTYVLRRWVEIHPATPSHGTEYSSGLEIGDQVSP